MFEDVNAQIQFHHEHGFGGECVDVGVTGSPCNPFSTQRTKRFQNGDVASHRFLTPPWIPLSDSMLSWNPNLE